MENSPKLLFADIHNLLRALGIKRVVAVDDEMFSVAADRDFYPLFQAAVNAGEIFPELDSLLDSSTADGDEFARVLGTLDEEIQNQCKQRLSNFAASNGSPVAADMQTRFRELFEDFDLNPCTRVSWEEASSRLAEESKTKQTLFLFDLDLSKNGGSPTEGVRLARWALENCPTSYIGLFSQTFNGGGAYSDWQKAVEELGIDKDELDRFVPIAKAHLADPLAVKSRLVVVGLANTYSALKREARSVLTAAQKKAQEEIALLSVNDFALIVFESSKEEGIWEVDTLFRLYNSYHRRQARELAARRKRVRQLVEKAREVLVFGGHHTDAPPSKAVEVIRSELYEPKSYINKLKLPLEAGDVFEVKIKNKWKQFVLLNQSCDLVVRSSGRRSEFTHTAILARITKDESTKTYKSELPYFADGRSGYVLLRDNLFIPLWVLDLCVFNENGEARITLTDSAPSGLVAHWPKHFEFVRGKATDLFDKIKALPPKKRLELSPHLANVSTNQVYTVAPSVDIRARKVVFEIRRTERLNASRVQGILSDYAQVVARVGYDHDYAKSSST